MYVFTFTFASWTVAWILTFLFTTDGGLVHETDKTIVDMLLYYHWGTVPLLAAEGLLAVFGLCRRSPRRVRIRLDTFEQKLLFFVGSTAAMANVLFNATVSSSPLAGRGDPLVR